MCHRGRFFDGQASEELIDGVLHEVEHDALLLHSVHDLPGDAAVFLVVGGAYHHIVEAEEAAYFEEGDAAFEAEGFGLGSKGEDDTAPVFVAVGHDKGPSR